VENNMTTQHTYNRLKNYVSAEHFGYVLAKFRLFESEGLILGGKDYELPQLRVFYENLKLPTVELSTITNPDEYEEKFDELIENLLLGIGRIRGLESISLNSDMISSIRQTIIDIVNNYHYDIAPPYKEYELGEKVRLYYQNVPVNATIISLGNADSHNRFYGLLIDSIYKVVHQQESDSPTNYILELQKRINIE
jgi:hypothetical protein